MAKFRLDPSSLPQLPIESARRLDALTPAEIEAAALADPDNPPLDERELDRVAAARRVREVRRRSGLSQAEFASLYRINVGRLRDWEQGRTSIDSAMRAYLDVIDSAPEAVKGALARTG